MLNLEQPHVVLAKRLDQLFAANFGDINARGGKADPSEPRKSVLSIAKQKSTEGCVFPPI